MQKTKSNLTDDSCLHGLFNDKFTAPWERATDHVITHQTAFLTSFSSLDHYASEACSSQEVQFRVLSPSKMFPLKKSSLFAWWVALTRPVSWADSVPTSPACSKLGPKKDRNSPSWSDRPRQSDQAAARNRLYLLTVPKIPHVVHCVHLNPDL